MAAYLSSPEDITTCRSVGDKRSSYDKHGEPCDGKAAVRQGIVDYHQSGDHNGE